MIRNILQLWNTNAHLKNGVLNLSGKQILFQSVKLRHYFCFGKLFDTKFEFMWIYLNWRWNECDSLRYKLVASGLKSVKMLANWRMWEIHASAHAKKIKNAQKYVIRQILTFFGSEIWASRIFFVTFAPNTQTYLLIFQTNSI